MNRSIGVVLDKAQKDIEQCIVEIMQREEIPAELMAFAVENAAAKIKELKCRDYAEFISTITAQEPEPQNNLDVDEIVVQDESGKCDEVG